MVNVGDKVFVAPLHGQKDNIAIITGPAGGTGAAGTSGIIEGDYNLWTWKWSKQPSNISGTDRWDMLIDDKNDKLSILYDDDNGKKRLSIYNISDFSAVYESPVGSDYLYAYPGNFNKTGIHEGIVRFEYGGASRSVQTYLLFLRNDESTIEVWRGGSAALWSRDTDIDFTRAVWCDSGGISPTGKYIVVSPQDKTTPYDNYLMLYEGFDSGTSTGVTETTISDTSKAWSTDVLIGHIVYVTSGGADGDSATITGNTGTVITCNAATFVTWGMSAGDTFKID